MSLLEKAARSDCKILKKPKELKTIFCKIGKKSEGPLNLKIFGLFFYLNPKKLNS